MPDFGNRGLNRRPLRPVPEPLRRPGRQNLQDLRGNQARQEEVAPTTEPAQGTTTAPAAGDTATAEREQVMAIDISHWSGAPDQSDIDAWKAAGVEHAVVGTQREEITQAQLASLQANGISTDAYVYLYFSRDMTDQVVTAFDRIDGYACGVLWLDVEDRGSAAGMTASQLVAKVQEAVEAAEVEIARRGLQMEVGIYTSWGFWTDLMDDSTAFSDLPLWYAHWDREADYTDWEDLSFGGWDASMIRGKQYQGDTYIDGADPIVDLNIMEVPTSAVASTGDQQAALDQDQLYAQLESIIGGNLRMAG